MEEVTKCRYIDCVDIREKEQILHELPAGDIGLCVKWLINSGHVDLVGRDLDCLRSMKFFICNNHFTEDCYLSKGTLKENAVPTPHWVAGGKVPVQSSRVRRFQKARLNGEEDSVEGAPTTVTATNTTTPTTATSATASMTTRTRMVGQFVEQNGLPGVEADRWCRTCATEKQDLVSMTTKRKGTEMSLLSKLKLLIEIDDEDALPTKMCDECVVKLEQSFKFFQQIYVADNALRRIFSKREIDDAARQTPRREVKKFSEASVNPWKPFEAEEERVPKVSRGTFFRRGRGRPRSRGYATRSRGRPPRSRPRPPSMSFAIPVSISVPPSISSPRKSEAALVNSIGVSETIESRSADETCTSRETNLLSFGDGEKQSTDGGGGGGGGGEGLCDNGNSGNGTVFSLLTDMCRSDEELDWSDVLKLMNQRELSRISPAQKDSTVRDRECDDSSNTIRCEFCAVAFKFRRELRTHLLTDHSRLSNYMCTDCVVCYESSAMLSKHRALRHGDRNYACDHCNREFGQKRRLRAHLRECQSRPTRYFCDFCGETFALKCVLVEHLSGHVAPSSASLETNSCKAKDVTGVLTEEKTGREEKRRAESHVIEQSQEPQESQTQSRSASNSFAADANTIAQCSLNPRAEDFAGTPLDMEKEGEGGEGQPRHVTEKAIVETAKQPVSKESSFNAEESTAVVDSVHPSSIKRRVSTSICQSEPSSSLSLEHREDEQSILDHRKRFKTSP